MRKYWTALILLFAASCLPGSEKQKLDKFLPPIESHGMTISGFGCDRLYVANSTSTSKNISFWTLILWAQYGKDHKKYWQKSYDTYQIPVMNSVNSNGESAASGEAIGGFETKSYDFTSLDKRCADWGALVQSTLKIGPNGEKVKDIDEPLAQLVERIPELKTLQPAPDQQELPLILQKMGQRMDDFVRDVGDLIAHEDVTQEQLNAKGDVKQNQRVQDEYLILHRGHEWGASAEYRMDGKGNRLGLIGLEKGYPVTSGFALSCIMFSTVAQAQSTFRYLGEQKMDSRETYVLGFAQKPGEATFTTAMLGTGGTQVDLLTQGTLWVDKNNFQIVRMRSDLLAPNKELRLDWETTEVALGEVQLQDVPNPLWLPTNVDVYMEIDNQKFRNVHHYTNYRRYRVSVKIGAPQ